MGHISFVGKLDGDTLEAGAPKVAPKWTLDLMGKHSLDFWLTSEDLPDPNNRVTINRDGEIVLQYKPNNEEGHKRLIKKLERLMQPAARLSRPRPRVPRRIVRAQFVSRPAYSARRRRAPKRHRAFWKRSENQRAGSQLQSARTRQSLRCRCQLLLLKRRGESRRSRSWPTRCGSAITCWSECTPDAPSQK